MLRVASSDVLSCPVTQYDKTTCVQTASGLVVPQSSCTLEHPCYCQTDTLKTPCAAFSEGFNYMATVSGVLGATLIVAVAAVKLMRLAGEDG